MPEINPSYPFGSSYESVNRAFSKQAAKYDADDKSNIVLQDMRKQVYRHVEKFLRPASTILELNAGTGIDASYFARTGHNVHATDVSDGMINEIKKKINDRHLDHTLTCQQLSYEQLELLGGKKFDYVFSNFGGLNCLDDLTKVTKHLPGLLNPGAYVTWVIMPPVCLWEWLWIFTGNGKHAFRRFNKNGVAAHLEGEYFKTYYHSFSQIRSAFGKDFNLKKTEGLAALSPPPSRGDFPERHPSTYKALRTLDKRVRSHFPFNRWADHIIMTFQTIS
jgi:ubiquinone/menaquinone biosynthesis C-methylase UbiE